MMSLMMAGCNVDFLNARPARELSPPAKVGNLYAGWRVFEAKCVSCHGIAATGSDKAPDLLPIVRGMSLQQFSAIVLSRYDLASGASRMLQDKSTVETRIDDIMRANDPPIEMPAWHRSCAWLPPWSWGRWPCQTWTCRRRLLALALPPLCHASRCSASPTGSPSASATTQPLVTTGPRPQVREV